MSSLFVLEKTKDGEFIYDIYSRLMKDRIIYIYEEIDADVGTAVSAALLWLNSRSKDPIEIMINSPGGTVADGLFTIYDTMNYIESPVHTLCIGTAYSAAAVILAAGAPGYRRAMPNAEIMIHELSSGYEGRQSEIERDSERLKKINDKLIKYVSLHTGKSIKEVDSLMRVDTFFDAEEALEFGLIDSIVETKVPKKQRKK